MRASQEPRVSVKVNSVHINNLFTIFHSFGARDPPTMRKGDSCQEKDPNAMLQLPEGRQESLGTRSRGDNLCVGPGSGTKIPGLENG